MSVFTASQTILGEYYLGDYPGTLQYKVKPTDIIKAIDTLDTRHGDLDCDFELVDIRDLETSEDLIKSVLPDTATANANTWTPLVIMRKKNDDEIWLKAALQNDQTGEIALMTSTNSYDRLIQMGSRGVHSRHSDWVIGHYRMVAPRSFWMTLAKLLLDQTNHH